jgi:hypothetical protein
MGKSAVFRPKCVRPVSEVKLLSVRLPEAEKRRIKTMAASQGVTNRKPSMRCLRPYSFNRVLVHADSQNGNCFQFSQIFVLRTFPFERMI